MSDLLRQRVSKSGATLIVGAALLIGGAGYFVWLAIERRVSERQVDEAMPRLRDAARAQLAMLTNAINAYRGEFGFYPPDHVTNRNPMIIDPVANPLLYELVGAGFDPAKQEYSVGGQVDPISKDELKGFIGLDQIRNSSTDTNKVHHFLPANPLPGMTELPASPEFCVLQFSQFDLGIDWRIAGKFQVSSWRYVSSSPTNNPRSYDLWLEIDANGRRIMIGNWKNAE